MTSVLVTHTDLDGISCAVLAKIFNVKFDSIYYWNYHEISPNLYKLKDFQFIVITDLSLPKDEHYRLLELNKKVICFDHHESSSWLKEINGNIHDTSRCGTKLFLEEFIMKHILKIPVSVFDYVKLVNVFDLWKTEDKQFSKALDLNRYTNQCLKQATTSDSKKEIMEKLANEFTTQLLQVQNSFNFTTEQLTAIAIEQKTEDTQFDEILKRISIRKDSKGLTFGVYENPKYANISILAYRALYTLNLDYVLICFLENISIIRNPIYSK